MESDRKKLRKYFIKRINVGDILSDDELERYALKRNLNVGKKYVRSLRDKVLPTLLHKQPLKVGIHRTITVDRLGLLSMDFAYYHPEWKWHNNNCVGFLMVNSVIASKQWAIPMKSRKTVEFESALEQVCKGGIFPEVRTILSDRETTITSRGFQKRMQDKYGIKFTFIHRYNKAWASELAIRHTKRNLSIALLSAGGKKWIKILSEVINTHNRKKIDGTQFSPNQINSSNFLEFLNQLHDIKDVTMNFSTNSIDSRSIVNKNWIKQLFKYRLNQKVLATKYSLEGRKVFGKSSVEGSYSKTPLFIRRAKLNQTRENTLVAGECCFYMLKVFPYSHFSLSVYQLADEAGTILPGFFYSTQLVPYPEE